MSLPPWKRPPVPPHPDQVRLLTEACAREQLSQRKLAVAIGISQSFLSLLCAGKRHPSRRTVELLEYTLDVTVPLPPGIAYAQTAAGRREDRKRARVVEAELARQRSIPRLETYWPSHLPRWT